MRKMQAIHLDSTILNYQKFLLLVICLRIDGVIIF
jgi:hypothetical protein